jgi:hypothetical protein
MEELYINAPTKIIGDLKKKWRIPNMAEARLEWAPSKVMLT